MDGKFLALKASVIVSGVTASFCAAAVRQGFPDTVADVCGGCPCYDRLIMAQMWTAFAVTIALVPVTCLLVQAYPVEPVAARAREVVRLALLSAERQQLDVNQESTRPEAV
eukprot:TRINITY_DN7945_c3_g1_i1.p1 TRINITY_DN7945_c3_g1~~TRINITY_DN7945_c3_g1_i1.p1  ORF type:complete len:120 (+),score=26.45 TRINITY_DN7945_c3_g1_i1:28-360(+)